MGRFALMLLVTCHPNVPDPLAIACFVWWVIESYREYSRWQN